MVDEIARIMGNMTQIPETGKVDKVKEVTPRPDERGNEPSPFGEISLKTQREREKAGEEKKKNMVKKGSSAEQGEDEEGKNGLVDIVA